MIGILVIITALAIVMALIAWGNVVFAAHCSPYGLRPPWRRSWRYYTLWAIPLTVFAAGGLYAIGYFRVW